MNIGVYVYVFVSISVPAIQPKFVVPPGHGVELQPLQVVRLLHTRPGFCKAKVVLVGGPWMVEDMKWLNLSSPLCFSRQ